MSGLNLNLLGDLISLIGMSQFNAAWRHVFSNAFGLHSCTVFHIPENAHPRSVLRGSEGSGHHKDSENYRRYVNGEFIYDQSLQKYYSDVSQDLYILDVNDIINEPYYNRYYKGSGISHEMGMFGRRETDVYYISAYRQEWMNPFDAADLAALRYFSSIILDILHRHNRLSLERNEDDKTGVKMFEGNAEGIDFLCDTFSSSPYNLSSREAEVCARIILGYSNLAISLHFGVSINTVMTYRKRAYAKLNISSQSELFNKCLSVMPPRKNGGFDLSLKDFNSAPGLIGVSGLS
jgi:DNA-binding CsgD family transcriptional regulator